MRWLVVLVVPVLALSTSLAHAAWPGFDPEDLMLDGPHRAGSSEMRGESWITLLGFTRQFSDRRDVGVMAMVGLAFDRIATGPVHAISDRPVPLPPAPAEPPKEPAKDTRPASSTSSVFSLDPRLARATVAAAWRAAGLGVDDTRIDAIVARARLSAALPETRLRAMRLVDTQGHVDTSTTTDNVRYYDMAGANLWLEARLTWHLDRLLYADDEPTLERVRLERIDARSRIAAKILEVLFQWQRALVDVKDAAPGTREELDARLRALEAEVALDVLTAGGFAKARAAALPAEAASATKQQAGHE